MFYAAKELSHVINMMPTLLNQTTSLTEPIHELPYVDGSIDEVHLLSYTMDFTMNEVSIVEASSVGLHKSSKAMILTYIEVADVFSAIALHQLAVAVPLAILEVSFILLDDSVMCTSSHADALVLEPTLESLLSIAFGFALAEAANVHGRAII